jgi:hypothetical protein
MTTPFTTFANATVTFKVRSGVPEYNEYGHLEDNLIDFPVVCFLTQKKKPMSNLMNEANQNEIYVEGRCITPKSLSPDILPESLGDATLDGIDYKFRLQSAISSPFFSEVDILGQKLEGYLIRTSLWGGDSNG